MPHQTTTIPSPLGDLDLAVTDGRHVHAEGTLTIRGNEYLVSAHLSRPEGGEWDAWTITEYADGGRGRTSLSVRKPDDWAWSSWKAPTVEKKARETVQGAVQLFVLADDSAAAMLHRAEVESTRSALDTARAKRDALAAELADAERVVTDATDRFAAAVAAASVTA